jgi:septum site-determining protein MinC
MDGIGKATRQSFRMRGRSYVAFTFCPVVPIAGWLEEIDVTLARSPEFFVGKPVVLDLSAVDLSQSAIAHLIKSLEQRNIRILGIEGVDAAHLTTSMPPLLTGGRHCLLCKTNRRSLRPNQSRSRCCSTAQCALVSRFLARVT